MERAEGILAIGGIWKSWSMPYGVYPARLTESHLEGKYTIQTSTFTFGGVRGEIAIYHQKLHAHIFFGWYVHCCVSWTGTKRTCNMSIYLMWCFSTFCFLLLYYYIVWLLLVGNSCYWLVLVAVLDVRVPFESPGSTSPIRVLTHTQLGCTVPLWLVYVARLWWLPMSVTWIEFRWATKKTLVVWCK